MFGNFSNIVGVKFFPFVKEKLLGLKELIIFGENGQNFTIFSPFLINIMHIFAYFLKMGMGKDGVNPLPQLSYYILCKVIAKLKFPILRMCPCIESQTQLLHL